jgi:hypothetical protein
MDQFCFNPVTADCQPVQDDRDAGGRPIARSPHAPPRLIEAACRCGLSQRKGASSPAGIRGKPNRPKINTVSISTAQSAVCHPTGNCARPSTG